MQYLERPKGDIGVIERRDALRQEILSPNVPPFMAEVQPAAASTASFHDFFRILQRRKWMIVSMLVVSVTMAIAIQFIVPKLYEGVALVKVDRHSADIDTQPNTSNGVGDDIDQIMTTEMELAVSDTVLRPVVERYNLWNAEKLTAGMSPEKAQQVRQGPIKLQKLSIKRPPNSSLIQIIYRAHDPALAANVANAIAESLAEHSNDSARARQLESSSVVTASLIKMRQKMNEADNQLAEYERQLGITDPEQRATVLGTRLKDLTSGLTIAQSERAARQATLEQVRRAASLSPDSAMAAAQIADSMVMPSANAVGEALTKLNQAKADYASISSFYGANHPENARAKHQVEELQQQIQSIVAGSLRRSQIAYEQARAREDNLGSLIATTKAEVDAMDAKASHYEQLRDEALNYRKFYNDLESRATIADINNSFAGNSVKLYSPARAPFEAVFPKLMLNLPIGVVLALLLGVVCAVLMDAVDSRFSGPEEIASQLRLDILAMVPESKMLKAATSRRAVTALVPKDNSKRAQRSADRYAEAIRTLRTAISFSLLEGSVKVLQITSSQPGEGKTTTSSSLAVAYAQAGKKVLLVDSDLRRPSVHRMFGIAQSPGLSELLQGQVSFNASINEIQPNLSVIAAGPATSRASELVSLFLASVLAKAAREYDLVIVDCPPVNGAAETLDIARMVDATVLVTQAEKSSGKLISATVSALRRSRGQVLGIVLNRISNFADSTYGYSYYYSAKDAFEEGPETPNNMVAAEANTAP